MQRDLPPKLTEMVRQKVESGEYSTESDVIEEALRRMDRDDAERELKLQWLREALEAGRRSGFVEHFSMDELIAELDGETRDSVKGG